MTRAIIAPTHDAPCACAEGTLFANAAPNGGAVLLNNNGTTIVSPTNRRPSGTPDVYNITRDGVPRLFPKTKAKDAAMPTPRSNMLAPNGHLTFHLHTIKPPHTRDAAYGENRSRFTSAEADRLSRHAPGASLPSPSELNSTYRAAHAGAGASGQSRDNTTQPGGEGGQPGILRRNSLHMAQSSPLGLRSVGNGPFDEFHADAARPSPAAVSELNARMASAKTPAARDELESAWRGYMGSKPNA